MKKLISITLAIATIFTLTILVAATGNVSIFSKANEWYAIVHEAGTVTVKDNKATYDFYFDAAGTYKIGLQKNYIGQLKFVDFKADEVHVCEYEAVVTDPTCSNDGYTTYTCIECGDSYIGDEVEALGHIEIEAWDAEIVDSIWNGKNGSDARFDIEIRLTFAMSRDGDIVEDAVFADAYFRNANFNNLAETFELTVGCYDVAVEVTLNAENSNQNAVFSIASRELSSCELICEN